jgi:hypothetical protein
MANIYHQINVNCVKENLRFSLRKGVKRGYIKENLRFSLRKGVKGDISP